MRRKASDRRIEVPNVLRVAGVLAAVLLIGVVSACTNTHVRTSNAGFQVSTPDGEVSVSLDGHLPPNWPTDFPLPAGAKPAGAGSLGSGRTTHRVAVYELRTGSGPDTLSFYESNSQLKTSNAKSAGHGSSYVGTLDITEPYSGSVTVVSHDRTMYLVAVIESHTGTATTAT